MTANATQYDNPYHPDYQPPSYALPEIVGDEFVGRREELGYLYHIIGRAPRKLAYSIALVARKGMGKTALMQRLFNLLFFDRETGVAPIYLSLAQYRPERTPERIVPQLTIRQFCELYTKTYISHLLAYRTQDPQLVQRRDWTFEELLTHAREEGQMDLVEEANNIGKQLERDRYILSDILTWPTMRAYRLQEPHVYMIDEFQVTHGIYTDDKQHVTSIKDNFQTVAEAKWAPLLISGSIVSLVTEVAFSGLLARRFKRRTLHELPPDEAKAQIQHLSQQLQVPVSTDVQDALIARTGGHPFYIWAILNSDALGTHSLALTHLKGLDQVFDYEMQAQDAHLRLYWQQNFQDHLTRINSEGLGEAILYWIASSEIEGDATPYKLVPLLRANQFDQVSEREVADKLRALYEIDLLERGLGMHSYRGLQDPVLNDFIRRNYYQDILRWSDREIADSWRRRYYELLGQTNYFRGRVAEGYVREMMRAFDGRQVEGATYFGIDADVHLPTFAEVHMRGGTLQDGRPIEIDVLGLPPDSEHSHPRRTSERGHPERIWLVEVKYRDTPLDQTEADAFLTKAAQVAEAYGYKEPTLWVVSKAGYTGPAEALLTERGVLYSDVAQFNALASALDALLLPE